MPAQIDIDAFSKAVEIRNELAPDRAKIELRL